MSACSVTAEMNVAEALKVLAQNDIGAVAVLDGATVIGVFSEHDLLRAEFAEGAAHEAIPVRQAMTACTVQAEPRQDVFKCLELMRDNRLQYIPVVDKGRLVGLIPLNVLQTEIIRQYEDVFRELELDLKIMFLQGTYSC